MTHPQAEILAIGSELLLGEINDTNTRTIARGLRDIGLNLFHASIVGDNLERIAESVELASSRSHVLLTTGGLGPTVDDITREAIARAAGVDLEFSEDLWQEIVERYAGFGRRPKENNRRQAHIPHGSHAIPNPVGTAPGFWLRLHGCLVVSMPGVPAEMELMLERRVFPLLRQELDLEAIIQTRILRTVGIGESDLDARIDDLELGANPTLGVSAHPGRVDLRLGARAETEAAAEAMLDMLESELRYRLGDLIYAVDDASLEQVIMAQIQDLAWKVITVEVGTGARLSRALAAYAPTFVGGLVLPESKAGSLLERLAQEKAQCEAELGLGLAFTGSAGRRKLGGWVVSPRGDTEFASKYAGPEEHGAEWGVSLLLSQLRDLLNEDAL